MRLVVPEAGVFKQTKKKTIQLVRKPGRVYVCACVCHCTCAFMRVRMCGTDASKRLGGVGRGPSTGDSWPMAEYCKPNISCPVSKYRSINGTCNSIQHPLRWGVANTPFRRTLPPNYADGIGQPRTGVAGPLPSARDVSVTVHRSSYAHESTFTVMLAVWGQFLDHDITATALNKGANGSSLSCCDPSQPAHPECFPVQLDKEDPFYEDYNLTCMEFVRSAPAPTCHFEKNWVRVRAGEVILVREDIQTSPNSMGLRRLITEFLWPPSSSIIRLWLPHSTKVLGKTNQTSPNSMGLRRLITEFPWLPSSSIIRLWLPYSTKVLGKTNQTSPNSMGLRRLITEFLWPPSCSIIRLWLPYSTKVLVKTNQTSPNSMGLRRLITEFPWPPSSSIIRLWLPYSTKVLVKTNKTSPNSMGLRRLITEFPWPPSSSIIRLWLPYSTKVLVKTNQTSPNSMGLRRLITEFLWPPSSSIIRLWLPYSTKVLGKTNQTSPNSMGLRRLITEFLWPPSSSIIRLWLPYSTKVLGKTNQTSPNSMGLRRLITEFLWPPSSSIIRLWLPYSTKVLGKTNQTSPNSMGLRRLITEFLWPPSSSIIRSALCPREQLNQATAFIDGSTIYGPSEEKVKRLRSYSGGALRMLEIGGVDLLPQSTDPDDSCNTAEMISKGKYCFESGDDRANENLHLTTMHLLWARQHNRLASILQKMNPDWDDETVFQESRKVVGAQMQHVTYNEFLPAILGSDVMWALNLTVETSGYTQLHDDGVDPSVANHFASSAFRFAHTLLPSLIHDVDVHSASDEYIHLRDMLFNPYMLYSAEGPRRAVQSALVTPVHSVDPHVTTELSNHLFEKPVSTNTSQPAHGPCGLDLVSLNIQRGRDHGLPSYPAWREHCGFPRPKTFDDLQEIFDDQSLQRIRIIYNPVWVEVTWVRHFREVDDIDLYTGALSERPRGRLLASTLTCLVADQFVRLKRGDRFWYENPPPYGFTLGQLEAVTIATVRTAETYDLTESSEIWSKWFEVDQSRLGYKSDAFLYEASNKEGANFVEVKVTQFVVVVDDSKKFLRRWHSFEQLTEIRKTTLAGIICANEGLLDEIQPRVMEYVSGTNPLMDCHELPQPDLGPWKQDQ
ncbi:Chorion peroxidase [Eumeta japonica]|uniref:Chorion peroxidase n=1 Tax=Eumeta variegata TaxID=151549 RepID=A0A4C1YRD0_EUMVA|nr:Chorion peroxidase [Eumeta japonica]